MGVVRCVWVCGRRLESEESFSESRLLSIQICRTCFPKSAESNFSENCWSNTCFLQIAIASLVIKLSLTSDTTTSLTVKALSSTQLTSSSLLTSSRAPFMTPTSTTAVPSLSAIAVPLGLKLGSWNLKPTAKLSFVSEQHCYSSWLNSASTFLMPRFLAFQRLTAASSIARTSS